MDLTVAEAIASIADDNRSGAMQIAQRAADILCQRALVGEAPSADAFRHELLVTGWALIRAKSVMAPLVNLVNAVLWRVESCDSPRSLRDAVFDETNSFKHQVRQHALRVAEGALGLIGDGSRIITNSYSGTVQHALCNAQRAGRRLDVFCAESRPSGEGRVTAETLMNCGVNARTVSDAEALELVASVDMVIFGADMLTGRGLVNKIGTAALAAAAQVSGRSCYSLCGSEKFLPPGFQPPPPHPLYHDYSQRDASAPRTDDMMMMFDLTPLEQLSSVVTEQGVLPIEGIEAWFATTRLHPALQQYALEAAHSAEAAHHS